MIDIILNYKQIVDMNCQDWYIIQQKQGEYTHESELIFKTVYVHVLRTYTAINMQGQCIRLQFVDFLFVYRLGKIREAWIEISKKQNEAIRKNGFCTKWPYAQYTYYVRNDGIALFDNDFQYPSEALEFVTNLNVECANYKIQEENCQSNCKKYLSRWPILKVGHIRYQVIMFERVIR